MSNDAEPMPADAEPTPPIPAESASNDEVIAQVLDLISHLAATVEELSAKVEAGQAAATASAEAPGFQESPVLEDWAERWLIPTFKLQTALQGWQETPALRSEVAALFAGYQEMTSSKASGWDALNWHSHRAAVVDRIMRYRQAHMIQASTNGIWADEEA